MGIINRMRQTQRDLASALPQFAVGSDPTQPRSNKLMRVLSKGRAKVRVASREGAQIFGLANSWQERVSLANFLMRLYLARTLPVHSYDWDATIHLAGSEYTVGLRTSEIYVLEEVFTYRMYDRHPAFIPSKGWTVLDVGANVGIVSILQARRGARVYAFEPNSDCYRRLVKNIRANGLQRLIEPCNVALGDRVGTGAMLVKKGGTTGGTVIRNGGSEDADLKTIEVTTLDRAVPPGVSRIDLLKIDVEGAEADVLRGAHRVLGITQRVVIEFHSRALLQEVRELLAQHGFVDELQVDYYPGDAATGQDEVGILYAVRPPSG
jgi:FkbM family methyltransferase